MRDHVISFQNFLHVNHWLYVLSENICLDSVHTGKNLFSLTENLYADLLSQLVQLMRHIIKGCLGTGNIHDHHHIEIFLQDRLRDVKNVHVVVSQIITRFCNDTDAVLSNDSNNNLTHSFHPPVCSPSYGGNVFMTYYDDETGVAIGPWFARSLKAKQGHIVIRVYPDGEYEVYAKDKKSN